MRRLTGVPLHVFRHVEAQQFDAEHLGQLLGDLRLADAGRPGEEVATIGFSPSRRPARDSLMAAASCPIAESWP